MTSFTDLNGEKREYTYGSNGWWRSTKICEFCCKQSERFHIANDFIEKVVIHEAEGGRTKDRTQQVDIYFNFIGNFVLPLSEDEVEALQSEEARRAEEIAERKRKSSKKSTQKRNQKRPEIKAKAEAGDPEAMAEYKAILEKGRQNNRKRSEKMRELRMSDPEYRAKMEEKERLALERESRLTQLKET